jgi:cystathionine beta-lyase/cystathionine gamma-synthase
MAKHDLETDLVHAGEPHPRIAGAVTLPVFQSSTYAYGGEGTYDDLRYMRLSNSPNHVALHDKIAALEGTEAALVTASGMAAVYVALLSSLGPGDHLIAQDCLYGGTHDLVVGHLAKLGIEHTFVPGDDPGAWEAAVRPSTKAVYCEAMTNPRLDVADFEGLVAFARRRGLVSMIDATFASPILFRPAAVGFDVVLHSATKYLNGHSDIVAGAMAASRARIDAARRLLNLVGASLDAHACFLLQRGLKTLAVRVRQQCASALVLARALEAHPAVASVRYPGLPSHPAHERASRLFSGRFGGMIALELAGGADAVASMMSTLSLWTNAPSLGGPESLVTVPAQTSHVGLSPEARAARGISDALVRLSVGLESPTDLLTALTQSI